jgi:hypothetical protein
MHFRIEATTVSVLGGLIGVASMLEDAEARGEQSQAVGGGCPRPAT